MCLQPLLDQRLHLHEGSSETGTQPSTIHSGSRGPSVRQTSITSV